MSDYRDLDWEMFTGHMFSKAELDEIYQQGRTDLLTEFKEQGAYDVIRADEREKVNEEILEYIDYLCFGFKASEGNLVRVDVVKETITKKLEQLKEQNCNKGSQPPIN